MSEESYEETKRRLLSDAIEENEKALKKDSTYNGAIEPEPEEGEVEISTNVAWDGVKESESDFSHVSHKKKRAMLVALKKSLGIVSTAAKISGVCRRNHYDWMASDPKYKKLVEEMNDIGLDFAESALFSQIKSGSTAATIFYLKCKGRARNYIEKENLDITSKGREVHITPLSFFETKEDGEDKDQ